MTAWAQATGNKLFLGEFGVDRSNYPRSGTKITFSDNAGSGPLLKYSGVSVVAGQFGTMTPIAAEETASKYQVAWKVTGTGQYEIWTTDSNGNYIFDTVSYREPATTWRRSRLVFIRI